MERKSNCKPTTGSPILSSTMVKRKRNDRITDTPLFVNAQRPLKELLDILRLDYSFGDSNMGFKSHHTRSCWKTRKPRIYHENIPYSCGISYLDEVPKGMQSV